MKKIISVLLAIVMMLTTMSVSVFAAEPLSGYCGENVTWTFNPDTGELTISGEGAMYDYYYYYYNRPWESYVDEITAVTIGDGVTSIGSYAFRYCTSLTSITIPDSVTSIGSNAFYDCDSLMKVTFNDSPASIGNDAFYSCDSLVKVTLGNAITSIGNSAFQACVSLTGIAIPDKPEFHNKILIKHKRDCIEIS